MSANLIRYCFYCGPMGLMSLLDLALWSFLPGKASSPKRSGTQAIESLRMTWSMGTRWISSRHPALRFLVKSFRYNPRYQRLALTLALSTIPGGLHVYAPVCASWTRISRGTSLRSHVSPLGNCDSTFVVGGNFMIARLFGSRFVKR